MTGGVVIIVFQVVVLIFSVVIHEVSHGYVAEWLGDPTARLAGRLTLNPLKHLDPVGSLILPAILIVTGAPVFGWAKPVPYNPYNLPDPRMGGGKIAAAGPFSNLALAIFFGLLMRLLAGSGILVPDHPLFLLFYIIVLLNVVLAIFNLIPIPPLDGSKVLYAFVPPSRTFSQIMDLLERYGFFILVILIFTGALTFIAPVINAVMALILGPGLS